MAYNGSKIPVIGIWKINLQHKKENHAVTFVMADTTSPPLLGLNTCHAMNLVKRIWIVDAVKPNFIQEYSDIFGELGCLKGEHRIEIDKSIPVIHPASKIPISMLHKLEAELDCMQKLDVLEKIEEPTDWVSSLVVVEKPNAQIRVCLDPKDLNRAIKHQHHPMPTVDKILSKLSGAAFFSKLDLRPAATGKSKLMN